MLRIVWFCSELIFLNSSFFFKFVSFLLYLFPLKHWWHLTLKKTWTKKKRNRPKMILFHVKNLIEIISLTKKNIQQHQVIFLCYFTFLCSCICFVRPKKLNSYRSVRILDNRRLMSELQFIVFVSYFSIYLPNFWIKKKTRFFDIF